MKLKKICALALAGTMVMSTLTGCSKASSNDTSSTKDTSSTTETTTETKTDTASSDATKSDENITITMMYSGTAAENDFETEQLPKLVHEAFPNITLEVTKLPDDQYYTALKTKLASGECPDMILVQPKYAGANSVIGLAKAGYLAPVTDLNAVKLAGTAGTESFTYDGEVYAIPSGVTMLGTYYNKDLFEKNGLSVPTNWDEFLNCCKVLKDAGVQPIVMGDKDMYVMQFGLYQIAANQIYAKNAAFDDKLRTGETKFTDKDTWDKVLEMYKTLYDNGYIQSSSLGLGAQQAIQKFIDGEAAMTFDGSFNAAAITAKGAVDFERGYFPLPGNAEGEDTYAAMAMGAGPAIYSGSKYIGQCQAILEKWFDGESDIYKAYADSGRFVVTYGYGSDKVNPLFQQFIDLYNNGKSFYWCNQGWPAGTESEMEALFSETIGGQGTQVPDIVKGMQLKFEELDTE
jgi:raffinose/stachyose/melibiose transport system substrate-binding protein